MRPGATWTGIAIVVLAVGIVIATALEKDSSSIIVFAGLVAGAGGLIARRQAVNRQKGKP